MSLLQLPLTCLLLLLALSAPLLAQVPQTLHYQGRVSISGSPYQGQGLFRFALVNTDGSVTYWSNDGTSIGGGQPGAAVQLQVSNGLYSVALGDTAMPNMTAIPPGVFTHADVRVRVWFDDGVNRSQLLAPDQRLAAVAYAVTATSAATVQNGSINLSSLAPEVSQQLTPTGTVIAWAGSENSAPPTGWLFCDGTSVSRSQYPQLFAVIGTAHGAADGSHFNLPDYAGRFLRGVDVHNARDPDRGSRTAMNPNGATGNTVGTVQPDDLKAHNHDTAYLSVSAGAGGGLNLSTPDTNQHRQTNGIYSSGGSPGNETRPVNASVNYLIKY